MASRNIADCVPELQVAWTDSQAEWKQLFPDQPQPFLTCTHRSGEEQEILTHPERPIKGAYGQHTSLFRK